MKLGKRVVENSNFLKQIQRAKAEHVRRSLLATASDEEIITLIEICGNILYWRVPLKPKQKARLQEHADSLRKLIRIKTPEKAKEYLIQHGNGALIAAILSPILIELARAVLEK